MNSYRADLHIHTLLSPCGSLEMSPDVILNVAAEKAIDIIGIADHNSTRQSVIIRKMAKKYGLFVLCGAEVCTKEEIHCLAFFEGDEELSDFQQYLDNHIIKIPNNPDKFGYQVVVDESENIIYEEENLLIASLDESIEDVEKKVHSLNGIFIPAHINKSVNSIISQLGFFPEDLAVDAIEISRHTTKEKFIKANSWSSKYTFTTSSDAHIPEDIGLVYSTFKMMKRSFDEIKKAFRGVDERGVEIK